MGATAAAVGAFLGGGSATATALTVGAGVVAGAAVADELAGSAPSVPPAPRPQEFGLETDPRKRQRQRNDAAAKAASETRRRAAIDSQGSRRILTDPLGLTSEPDSERKTLLGL